MKLLNQADPLEFSLEIGMKDTFWSHQSASWVKWKVYEDSYQYICMQNRSIETITKLLKGDMVND